MGIPQALPVFTSEEYLSLERVSEIRHEYLDGLVYPISGENAEQSIICFNLAAIIGSQLKDKPCRGF